LLFRIRPKKASQTYYIQHYNETEPCGTFLTLPGETKNLKKYEEQIAKINATEYEAMERFAKVLFNSWTIDQAFSVMMR